MYVISDQRADCLVALPALDPDALFHPLVAPAAFGPLSRPAGLCLGPGPAVHVADAGNQRVATVSLASGSWTGFGAGLLADPRDVAVDADGRLYVADSRQVVRADGPDGTGLVVLSAVQRQRPTSVAVDPGGRLYIVDAAARAVLVSVDDGRTWDLLAMPEAEAASRPLSVSARQHGGVLVADPGTRRVVAFDAAGTATTLVSADDGLFVPVVAVEDGPGITVLDAGPEWVRRFLPVGGGYVAADFVRGRRGDGTRRFARPAGLATGTAS
jgi:streptogramin lyase